MVERLQNGMAARCATLPFIRHCICLTVFLERAILLRGQTITVCYGICLHLASTVCSNVSNYSSLQKRTIIVQITERPESEREDALIA